MNSKNLVHNPLSQDSNLIKIKDLLVKEFSPLKMYLFGSRANGQFRPDSDYDILLLVSKRNGTRLENMQKARLLLFEQSLLGDIFVYTQEEFNLYKNEFNSIPEIVFSQGLEISLGN